MTSYARLGSYPPASTIRRLVRPRDGLLLVGTVGVVIAVIVGLLAMHVIASSAGGHSTAATTMTMGGGPDDPMVSQHGGAFVSADSMSDPVVVTASGTSGDEAPDHTMADMACVLALLFGTLTLLGSAASHRPRMGTFEDGHGGLAPDAVAGAREQGPPPDLNFLSISRT